MWVLLNDLPENDFKTVVNSLVTIRQGSMPLFVTVRIVPGSLYERLFTSASLHLFCSSNIQNWLSKAPEDLTRNQIPAYDVDENARCKRLLIVHKAYTQQFRKDFTFFLGLRAKELVHGGRMAVSLPGMRSSEIASKFYHLWEIFAQILVVMVSEGVIDKAKFDSFYVPVYGPSDEELREIIQEEGSFSIFEMQVHDTLDVDDTRVTASWYAHQMRAALEPIVVQHFGEVMDEIVRTTERRWSPEGSLQDELARYPLAQLVVSLTKMA